MTLYKVAKTYRSNDEIDYVVLPYDFWGHIKCCIKWYGFRGLKKTYISEKRANKVATKLKNREEN